MSDNGPQIIYVYPGTKHGHTGGGARTATYTSWQNMIARCTAPSYPSYKQYKERGITICHRWRKFENFLADMGERPKGLTLDRIDNDGNYEPGNCRWATKQEQANNRITNLHFTYNGKDYTLADLARETGVSKDVLRQRLVRSSGPNSRLKKPKQWTVEEAVNTPVRKYKHY